jgi:hypothetical protein
LPWGEESSEEVLRTADFLYGEAFPPSAGPSERQLPQGKKTSAHKGDGEFGPNSSLLAPHRPLTGMLVARASIRPKFDSSRDLRLLFGQPQGKIFSSSSQKRLEVAF